jgi:hypothetical protein
LRGLPACYRSGHARLIDRSREEQLAVLDPSDLLARVSVVVGGTVFEWQQRRPARVDGAAVHGGDDRVPSRVAARALERPSG